MKTTEAVIGRWKEIFYALNVDVGDGNHKPCPICEGTDRFRFDDKNGKGTWFCSGCDKQSGDGFALVMKYFKCEFREACQKIEQAINLSSETKGKVYEKPKKDPAVYLRQLYKESSRLTGSCLGSIYLNHRGLSVTPNTLRYIESCHEPKTKQKMPAILATFSAPDTEALTLHRIYISNKGQKPDLENHKLTLPPIKPLAGGAVRLFSADRCILGIAEGIENAIAAHELYNIPVWATLTANLMETFEPPEGINEFVVFGDNDKSYTGQKAAYSLANRLTVKYKKTVDVEIPDIKGQDWLDVLNLNNSVI